MLTRNEEGKLSLSRLEIPIFFGDLFEICNNRKEVEILATVKGGAIAVPLAVTVEYLTVGTM